MRVRLFAFPIFERIFKPSFLRFTPTVKAKQHETFENPGCNFPTLYTNLHLLIITMIVNNILIMNTLKDRVMTFGIYLHSIQDIYYVMKG